MHRLIVTLALVLVGCATTPSTPTATLTGTITSPAEFSLPPAARLHLILTQRPTAGDENLVIARKTLPVSGNFPLAFQLPYTPAELSPESEIILLAQITVHGATWFSNVLAPTPVDGDGPLEVPVRRDGVML